MMNPEDTHEFSRSERERLRGTGRDSGRIVEELATIRRKLKGIETGLALNRLDHWVAAEEVSRQISRIDRLTDAIQSKEHAT